MGRGPRGAPVLHGSALGASLPVLDTLPSSTWEPLEASGNDAVAIEDSIPGTSPHRATLVAPAS